ncbi:TPA: SphA family protein [Burkholderia cenocepacia]|uniref:Phenol degradation protein meta n=1 Tax=Burkholderia latens TaxID=488446 RepID=A0A6H9SXS0_9BURK|nr:MULTISPECIES: transporter [Burkholderia]KAB0644696.1 phenol degradation protein meta [Burkholderia latens]MBJ9922851.1 transporter [Burkholderia cenocepacia]UJH78813.1 transporter [Burkholderia cenocepacia]VWB23014.1 protein involved in MetA-pathway of phenol degradation-like protein [Burkholderia latens]HDR9879862.1 phenol degradation protein meta [Burkholderia cenocepacia]
MILRITDLILRLLCWIAIALSTSLAGPAFSQTAVGRPPTVSEPSGLNLGSTSFFDGFSGLAGWSYLGEARYSTADSIKNADGSTNNAFRHPRVEAFTWINHVAFTSPWHLAGGTLGFNVIVPVTRLHGSFDRPGASLSGGGTALGDITFGPQLQYAPILGSSGQPLFVQRFELDVIAPTGQYKHNADLNQSSGYFSLNPYWAASLFPLPKIEISWRLHYLYNFKNHDPAASYPLAFDNQPVSDTQAGQAAWLNFTTSYALTPSMHLGINGYYLRQLTDHRINGTSVAGREQVLGIGPGIFWQMKGNRALWLNAYTETAVRNRTRNSLIVQAQLATPF